MGEGESDAFRAGGDDIDALAAVVGKGWAKDKSASGPREGLKCRGVRNRRRQDRVGQEGG